MILDTVLPRTQSTFQSFLQVFSLPLRPNEEEMKIFFFQMRDLPVAADRVKSAFSPSLG